MTVRQAMTWVCGVLVALQVLAHVPAAQAKGSAFGQIVGVICDDKTGRPLDFANVILVGTTMGAMARNGGRFAISNVPAGEYRVKASFVGYDPMTLQVVVEPNQTSTVSFCGGASAKPSQQMRTLSDPGCGELRVVNSMGAITGRLPLRQTRVRATIAGSVTHVVVEQTFENETDRAIEALYVFPLPHRAAIDDMQIQIGERVIRAAIRKRQEAVQIYQAARHEGRVAALLEQERPNIFTQHVTNIMPGHDVVVRIRYFEELQWNSGYELVVPTVVGPRYIPGTPTVSSNMPASAPESGGGQDHGPSPDPGDRGGTGWSPDTDLVPDASRITPHVLRPGADGGHDIDIVVDLDAGVPLETIESVNHAADVVRDGESRARVQLRPTDTIPNKDFVLRYRVAADRLRFGVLAHRESGADLGYFTLLMRPPSATDRAESLPLDLVLVLDVSGSMRGAPLETEKGVVRWMLQRLQPHDRVTIIDFDNMPRMRLPSAQAATADNLESALRHLESLQAQGGTEMLAAIRSALALPSGPERNRVICMLTDGFVGNEAQIMREVEVHRGAARLFVIGIGSSPNRFLVDGLAEAGLGAHGFVALDEDPRPAVHRCFEQIDGAILSDIAIDWNGLQVQDVQPNSLPHLFADRPLQITGRYAAAGFEDIVIRGRQGGRPFQHRMRVRLPATAASHDELEVLWARQRIHDFERGTRSTDVDSAREVEKLGLEFGLLTHHTSFVATDNQIVSKDGVPTLLLQPVDMPLGLRHDGVFGGAGGGLRLGVSGTVPTIVVKGYPRSVDVKSSDMSHVQTEKEVKSIAPNTGTVVQGGMRGGRSPEMGMPPPPASPAPDPSPRTAPTVRIELESERVQHGERLMVRIVIENNTGQAIRVPEQVRLGDGSLIVSVSFGDILLPPPERSSSEVLHTMTLHPGEGRAYSVALSGVDGYVLSKRGTYQIRFLMAGGFPVGGLDQVQTFTVY